MERIVQIIPTLDQGGAEKQMSLLAAGLKRHGFDIEVCVLTRSGPWLEYLEKHDVPVTLINKAKKLDVPALRRLNKYLKSAKPDLVQTWLFAANSYGRWAARRAKVPKIVASERCVDEWKSGYHFLIDRFFAKRTDKIVVNSHSIVDFYENKGISRDLFEVIPNGIEVTDSSSSSAKTKSLLLKNLGLSAGTHFIGCVGRLWPQKRVKDLIWATDLIKCVRSDVHLLIIGDGPQRMELENYADKVQVLDHVHFLGHRDDAAEMIGACDLLWVGSEFEGQSNVIMEAMNAETPVVATDIAGNRDLIRHQETGILVPLGDRAAFATWGRELLNDSTRRLELAHSAKQYLRDEFSLEQMVERYCKLYRSLLGTGSA